MYSNYVSAFANGLRLFWYARVNAVRASILGTVLEMAAGSWYCYFFWPNRDWSRVTMTTVVHSVASAVANAVANACNKVDYKCTCRTTPSAHAAQHDLLLSRAFIEIAV